MFRFKYSTPQYIYCHDNHICSCWCIVFNKESYRWTRVFNKGNITLIKDMSMRTIRKEEIIFILDGTKIYSDPSYDAQANVFQPNISAGQKNIGLLSD